MQRTFLIAILSAAASAQSLRFEVASIKRSVPDPHASMTLPMPVKGGALRLANITVKSLLMNAYNVRDFQISGGPSWLVSDRYDIDAKPERAAAPDNLPDGASQMSDAQRKTATDQLRERTRSLLAERFHLAVHSETKEQPIYALVLAKGGSKLPETPEGAPGAGAMRMEIGQINGSGVPLSVLTGVLSMQTGRPVQDLTGLVAKYDIKLEWQPDPALGGPLDRRPAGAEPAPPSSTERPPLLIALQEQLGLRLDPRRGPVEIIVIDRIERPTEN